MEVDFCLIFVHQKRQHESSTQKLPGGETHRVSSQQDFFSAGVTLHYRNVNASPFGVHFLPNDQPVDLEGQVISLFTFLCFVS